MSKKPGRLSKNPLFDSLKRNLHSYQADEIVGLFEQVDEARVDALAAGLASYISKNLPQAIMKRRGLSDYRTNPYVLLTSANVMKLSDPKRFADFLFHNKLYMGLETSFGKNIEATFVRHYPLVPKAAHKWGDPPEKIAEFASLEGLSRQEKARQRNKSVWREIDKSCVVGNRRYLVSIKSGPNCINDTQVAGMTDAISLRHPEWLAQSKVTYPNVTDLDVVIGITYGTDRSTNNKENQILVKLMEAGFIVHEHEGTGILVHKPTMHTRAYRRIGKDFWAFIGNPASPESAPFVFLEVLLALAKALSKGIKEAEIESRINLKIDALSQAFQSLKFPRHVLPEWVREDFNEDELFWFVAAMSSFYDEGI